MTFTSWMAKHPSQDCCTNACGEEGSMAWCRSELPGKTRQRWGLGPLHPKPGDGSYSCPGSGHPSLWELPFHKAMTLVPGPPGPNPRMQVLSPKWLKWHLLDFPFRLITGIYFYYHYRLVPKSSRLSGSLSWAFGSDLCTWCSFCYDKLSIICWFTFNY